MIRNICSVVGGLAVGMGVNMAIVMLAGLLFPMPEGLDFADSEAVSAYIAGLPPVAMLLIMGAHLAQAFTGGWLAALISKNRPMLVAMIVGGLSLVAGLINMSIIPLPGWMWIEMPLYLVAAWAAAKVELARRAARIN